MKKETKPLRILVVEDNPGDQILLKKYLQRSQLPFEELLFASRLSEADEVLRRNEVDLAFLDLTLPDSTGTQSFMSLNDSLPHTPIIVLSGLTDLDAATETISLGAQDFLMKGEFDERLLTKSIQYSIERKKSQVKLEESNERYEIVNKATRDIIWDWNINTKEILVNDKMEEVLGYRDKFVTEEWLMNALHPDDRQRIDLALKSALSNKLNNWDIEYQLRAAGGDYRFISAKGYILYNSNGEPFRMIGSLTDITEKRKLENELVAQKLDHQKLITESTIQAQEKEREELGKELHDNINQVLATVKMFLDMAKKENCAHLDLVTRSHENVSYAIEEIRKLSKSLVAPSLGDIGLKEALEELAEEINFTKGLNVDLDYENDRETRLESGIELMLYRITQEQLNNIGKYAKATHVIIKLGIKPGELFLDISDNGVGFDPTKKAKGIGLKNISNRVEFYNGSMEIISAPGEGCRLKIMIPLKNAS